MGRRGGGGTEMTPEPTLCLVMEKGPLEGQELKFSPGARIQIGRILRGNTLAVKDAGISTKHLVITFAADAGGWTISDLDSSNGTHLNSNTLEPFTPALLSDDDVIKIGELTSIRVRIVEEDSIRGMGKPPRGPKSVAETESVAEKLRPRRGRVPKKEEIIDLEDEVVETRRTTRAMLKEVIPVEIVSTRRARSARREGNVELPVAKKGARSRKNTSQTANEVEKVEEEKLGSEIEEISEAEKDSIVEKENVMEKANTRREGNVEELVTRKGAGSQKNTSQTVTEVEKMDEERLGLEIEESKQVSEDLIVEKGNVGNVGIANTRREGNVEKPVARKGARSRKNASQTVNEVDKVEDKLSSKIEESKEVDEDLMVEKEIVGNAEKENKRSEGNVKDLQAKKGARSCKNTNQTANEVERLEEDKLGSKIEERREAEEDLIVEKGNVWKAGSSGTQPVKFKELDLEKMTIGEFVDYLEEYLPKRIIAETDEMISNMREKSRRVHEFILEQKKASGKAVG